MSNEGLKEYNDYKKNQKENKRKKNRDKFDTYNFNIIKEFNNIITFENKGETYFFTEATGKVRKKGSKSNISLEGFLKGNSIINKKSTEFTNLESYKHKYAKDIMFDWIKYAEENPYNGLYSKVGQIEWRSNYGVFKELKFYTTSSGYYFETSGGIQNNSHNIVGDPDNYFDKDFDRGSILFVPDITIFHKGMAVFFIEIVNTNDVSDIKLKRMQDFAEREGYFPTLYKIKADDILNINVGNVPNFIKCEEINL